MITRAACRRERERQHGLGGDVREREVGLGQLVLAQVGLPDVDRDAVVGRVPLARLDRLRVEVERQHRGEAELRGGDREHAGAAADVEHAAARLGLEQLEAEPRRRMPAGAEGAAGIDHDRDRVRVRLLPGRADPEPADPDGLVELPPAVLPVLLDVGDRGAAERLPDPLLAGRVRVRGELEPAARLSISSKPSGKSSSMTARACSARAAGTVTETRLSRRGQRRALLSFSKKPSSRR